nr:hypothetical protein [Cressdnaviricota sp.]
MPVPTEIAACYQRLIFVACYESLLKNHDKATAYYERADDLAAGYPELLDHDISISNDRAVEAADKTLASLYQDCCNLTSTSFANFLKNLGWLPMLRVAHTHIDLFFQEFTSIAMTCDTFQEFLMITNPDLFELYPNIQADIELRVTQSQDITLSLDYSALPPIARYLGLYIEQLQFQTGIDVKQFDADDMLMLLTIFFEQRALFLDMINDNI